LGGELRVKIRVGVKVMVRVEGFNPDSPKPDSPKP